MSKIFPSIFIIYLSIAFVVFSFLSCKKSAKTYYDTGEMKEVISLNSDSLKHGEYKRFHINGNIAETGEFENGKQVETKKLFFDNGKLESESKYENGILQGFHRVYYPSGKLMIDAKYENNMLSGSFKKFYENGVIKEVVTFVEGEENGPFEEYYQNGKIMWKGTYKMFNDEPRESGELDSFGLDGQIAKKMFCDSLFLCRTTWRKS